MISPQKLGGVIYFRFLHVTSFVAGKLYFSESCNSERVTFRFLSLIIQRKPIDRKMKVQRKFKKEDARC